MPIPTSAPLYTVHYGCTYCGHQWHDQVPFVRQGIWPLNWCDLCGVTLPKKGLRIRYGAPDRIPAAACFADNHLERGGIYTIRKVLRWQHGCELELKETAYFRFHLQLFTPLSFRRVVRDVS